MRTIFNAKSYWYWTDDKQESYYCFICDDVIDIDIRHRASHFTKKHGFIWRDRNWVQKVRVVR